MNSPRWEHYHVGFPSIAATEALRVSPLSSATFENDFSSDEEQRSGVYSRLFSAHNPLKFREKIGILPLHWQIVKLRVGRAKMTAGMLLREVLKLSM